MKKIDYSSLYLVADETLGGRRLEKTVKDAISGGVTIVQFRDKHSHAGDTIVRAKRLHAITKKARVPLIINDRVDVAVAMDAEGVHVGQDDLPAKLARKIIGKKKILGVSAKTVQEARRAEKDGADYVGVGDIFGTTSKADAGKPIGLDRLRRIALSVRIPVVGIGGITTENAGSVIEAGAVGIAVVSAIVSASNPRRAAKELRSIISSKLRL